MTNKNVVLITGVSGFWGEQVASQLIARRDSKGEPCFHVIGVDSEEPTTEIKGLDFIQADVRNPLLVELLRMEGVRTVCHLVFVERVRPSESAFDVNVMGTMKVLGACSEAGVSKVVIKSSMAVYGAKPTNPTFLTEEHPLQGSQSYGYTHHLVEIEAFLNGFRHQVPEMAMTILRFASIVGTKSDTPMTRFLKEPLAPVLMGFDPLMQVIHEQDVVDALAYATLNDVPGVYNVAAEGILPLRQLISLAGKIPLPVFHPLAYLSTGIMNVAGLRAGLYVPIEFDYLRYPWVGDITKMKDELGFKPRYTAEQALREFAGEQRLRRFMPESAALAYDEERLRDNLDRRRQAKQADSAKQAGEEGEGKDE